MTAPKMELRRAPEPAPNAEGWYYGKFLSWLDGPIPVQVVKGKTYGMLWAVDVSWDDVRLQDLREVEWFGPVPECVPACT